MKGLRNIRGGNTPKSGTKAGETVKGEGKHAELRLALAWLNKWYVDKVIRRCECLSLAVSYLILFPAGKWKASEISLFKMVLPVESAVRETFSKAITQ